jgi:hypothetical protein
VSPLIADAPAHHDEVGAIRIADQDLRALYADHVDALSCWDYFQLVTDAYIRTAFVVRQRHMVPSGRCCQRSAWALGGFRQGLIWVGFGARMAAGASYAALRAIYWISARRYLSHRRDA